MEETNGKDEGKSDNKEQNVEVQADGTTNDWNQLRTAKERLLKEKMKRGR